ncbi:MAG TPA: ATP-binding protein [Mariprofundaceae bacterium]|nr:ATP-binding protein [Mariprofundaceae bacterium]
MLALQWSLQLLRLPDAPQLLFQFASDIVVAGVLVFATGGITSPFSFILGLVVLASGTLGRIMLPLVTGVLACMAFLVAVYADFARQNLPLEAEDSLHVLLQTSAILLVGGVMAFIARRHAGLRSLSDFAVRQHRKLKGLHTRVMSAMSEGVIVLDGRLGLYEMNTSARNLLSHERADDEGALEHLFEDLPELRKRLESGKYADFHEEYESEGRSLLVTSKRLQAAVDSDSEPEWLLTLVDISELRRLEEKLIAQEKMAALGQMSAMLAHEIRNPIQTMAQGLELMKADKADGVAIQRILHEEMLRLNRLSTMMLDYSRPLEASPRLNEASRLVEAAINQADLEQRSVCWHCDVDDLYVDPDHFRLVLDNLLSNALKNRVSETMVEVSLENDPGEWRLKVSNHGKISDALKTSLFQPFVSGGASGIGLGLSTVKQVCDLNDWSVHVDEHDGFVIFIINGSLKAMPKSEEELDHG